MSVFFTRLRGRSKRAMTSSAAGPARRSAGW